MPPETEAGTPFIALNNTNMRYSLFFYLLLAGTILTWSACDDEDDTACELNIPELAYSDGNCSPELYEYTDLLGFPGNDGLVFTSGCASATDHAQIIRLNLAPTAGDEVTIHVYNATYGYANIEVFGSIDCGVSADALGSCFSTNAVADKFTVGGLNAYAEIFVRIDVSASGPNDTFKEYMPVADEYIAIAAYGNEPQSVASSEYAGYNPEFQLNRLDFSCDGSTTQRVILGSCNPDADVRSWLAEVGLNESETYAGAGGVVTAADVPPGMDPNTTGTALKRRRPTQDTDDYYAEEDFILTIPAPGEPGLIDAQDLDPNFGEALDCLTFEPGGASSASRENNIVVTMIDGGADMSGGNSSIWERHINLSIDQPYARLGFLGYDFIYGNDMPFDEFGHGTTTAGALIGNYSGEQSLTVIHNKIFSVQPGYGTYGTYFGAVVATQIAGNINSDVINMSFGLSPEEEPQALRCAVEYAISQGAVIITSAGNDTLNTNLAPQWPAAFSTLYAPQLVSVTSYNYPPGGFPELDPVRSSFANFGLFTTNLAAYLTAKTPTYGGSVDDFSYLTGTSISAPLFAAAVCQSLTEGVFVGDLISSLPSSGALTSEVQNGTYLPVCE